MREARMLERNRIAREMHDVLGHRLSLVATYAGAPATSYWQLRGARLLTALAQALFWAVMGPVVVGLFAPEVRGVWSGHCPSPVRSPSCSVFPLAPGLG